MRIEETGSVRVDLVGGTLDLEPINLIIPNVVTLNVATSLKAHVAVTLTNNDYIEIKSLDYNKTYQFYESELTDENLSNSQYFEEMSFVLQILNLFGYRRGISLELQSGAPAGSGLGGSSAMGVTLFKALDKLMGKSTSISNSVLQVKGIESRILNQGVPGYQDYYPALTGGILSLWGEPGHIKYEQLYTPELKAFLESHLTLIYSGISRNSGINNWDVYKNFFDDKNDVKASLTEIAQISFKTLCAIKNKNFLSIPSLISQEGESRKSLAPNIAPEKILRLIDALKDQSLASGFKMCGAGGGGCFIVIHDEHSIDQKKSFRDLIDQFDMQQLEFIIEEPL